jgi:hypothetical protein
MRAMACALVVLGFEAHVEAEPGARENRAKSQVGAALLASFSKGGTAPGAIVEGSVPILSDYPALHVGAFATTARDETFQEGRVWWYRAAGFAGIRYPLVHSRWTLDATADALAAYVRIAGIGFEHPRVSNGFDLGFAPMFRIGREMGRLQPWFGVGANVWLWGNRAALIGTDKKYYLPDVEALAALGVLASF